MNDNIRLKFFYFGTILGIGFLLLSFFVNKDTFRSFDYNTTIASQKILSTSLNLPFSYLTLFGAAEVTGMMLGILFIVLFIRKKRIFLGLGLYFTIFILEILGKLVIFHPKPPLSMVRSVTIVSLPSSLFVHTAFSFPSGHVARLTFIIVILSSLIIFFNKKPFIKIVTILFSIFFVLIIIVSRIYLGEHWFSDTLGGALLGGSLASFSLFFF